MKTTPYLFSLAVLAVSGLLACSAGAQTKATNDAKAGAPKAGAPATNAPAAVVELPIPVSVFEFTNVGVKDPFYPLSPRLAIPMATNSAPAIVGSAFQLRALSGTGPDRLATINNRTLAAGEESKVDTATGPVVIHCIEIRESSVVIRVQNQPDLIELRFRKGF